MNKVHVFTERCEPVFADRNLQKEKIYLERDGEVVIEEIAPTIKQIKSNNISENVLQVANILIEGAKIPKEIGERLLNKKITIKKQTTTEVRYTWKNNNFLLYLFNEKGLASAKESPISLHEKLNTLKKTKGELKAIKRIFIISFGVLVAIFTIPYIVCFLGGIKYDVDKTVSEVIQNISITSSRTTESGSSEYGVFQVIWAIIQIIIALGVGYWQTKESNLFSGVILGGLWFLLMGIGFPWILIGIAAWFLYSMQNIAVLIVDDIILGVSIIFSMLYFKKSLRKLGEEVEKTEKMVQ